ncbi:hypothetical protein WG922_18275 [Ramlibacter sp. AN1015]|uniref:hypothetical protein n=1 Tax=Ramlibacter sp. AN1015 TaxID=3133428 RepID=UPI0030C2432D
MKHLLIAALLWPLALFAQDKHSKEDIAKDVERHRAMATAHEAAARCLESGKSPEICQRELLAACKGLAIGKYCGMRHAH